MSRICYYVRTGQKGLEVLSADPQAILDPGVLPVDAEVMDIDKAYDPIAWLASPLKRAETAHLTRLINEPRWPDDEAQASARRLDEMAIDDAAAAIEGRSEERMDKIDLGMGGAAVFRPDQVKRLARAVSDLRQELLRQQADFRAMDEDDVQPGGWIQEGESLLATYVFPALTRLKAFYAAASQQGQTVLVVWT
ncbi:MAG TPA: DUF1877 family protein [Caulobacteraceae bacterium]|nr:DUF1877 family protein [Caulobacteraceae bacterium]